MDFSAKYDYICYFRLPARPQRLMIGGPTGLPIVERDMNRQGAERENGMRSLIHDTKLVQAQDVKVTAETLTVDLADGRVISVPLAWFPRLLYGTQAERNNWRMIGRGQGIHWPELDEDIKVEHLLQGKGSAESRQSLEKWLKERVAQGK